LTDAARAVRAFTDAARHLSDRSEFVVALGLRVLRRDRDANSTCARMAARNAGLAGISANVEPRHLDLDQPRALLRAQRASASGSCRSPPSVVGGRPEGSFDATDRWWGVRWTLTPLGEPGRVRRAAVSRGRSTGACGRSGVGI
jgi:hypothetical protein